MKDDEALVREISEQLKKEVSEMLREELDKEIRLTAQEVAQSGSRDVLIHGAEVCALGGKHRFKLYWVKENQDKYYYVFYCDCGKRCAYSKSVLRYLLGRGH